MKKDRDSVYISLPIRFQNYGVLIMQVFIYFIYALPCRFIYRLERSFLGSVEGSRRGSLIVANHVSVTDPFVVLAHIPFHIFLRIAPIYFPIDPDYFRKFFFRVWLAMLGGYDAGRTRKEKFLMIIRTRTLLRRGETVFLFPEGKINTMALGEFERGIEYFARESRGVMLVKIGGFLPRLSLRRRITFLGVKTFTQDDTILADELREMFLANE